MKNFIAKEGYLSIAFVFVLWILVWIFWSFSFILFFLLLILLFIFRTPSRKLVCDDKLAILSPIDGKVTKIENCKHKDLGECIELSIKNSFYDSGVLNSPIKMHIEEIRAKHGLFLCSKLEAAKRMNERVFILAKAEGQKIALRIYAGSLDRKLKLDNISYDLNCGDKLGFLINGSIHLFLPKQARIYAGLGDYISSGSLLGYLGKI
ncbi:MAG: phosphatidylserine decarboxylase [Campylobacter sp.]|nr:phosphatidylserine decarboxylase [Campylobacter sp.]